MTDDFFQGISNTGNPIEYADNVRRYQTQLPLGISWPTMTGSLTPRDLYSDDNSIYMYYPSGLNKTAIEIQQRDRYGGVTFTLLSGSVNLFIQASEYFADPNPAFISAPYTVSGESGTDLILASYAEDTPNNPQNYWINLPSPGTYKVVFPNPVVSTALTVTHSGSSPYIFSQMLPRKSVGGYDIDVNAIRAYHVSATLIDTIALQVADSIVVGPELIGAKSIDGSKIIDGTISGVLIKDGTVTGNKVLAGTISGVLLQGSTITGDKIVSNTITAVHIAFGTITGDKITAGTISGELITAGSITSNQIAVSGITAINMAANSITADNINVRTITADKIILNGITADEMAAAAVTSTVLANNAVVSGKVAASAIYGENIVGGTITGYHVAANTITAGQIAVGTITFNEIASNTLTAAQIANGTLTGQKILDGTISGVLIREGTITGSKILANTISGALITAGTIKGVNIEALTISGALITAGTITATNIAVSGITADRIKVTQLDALTANMGTLTVNSGISIGANGYIWTGTGDVATPTTGLKIYTTGGVSRLTTYAGGQAQVDIGSDGKLTAGQTVVDSQGVTVGNITQALDNSDAIKIMSSGSGGNNGGLAFFNGAYSPTIPQAQITTDSTSSFVLSNNVPDGYFIIGNADTGANTIFLYNSNIDIMPTSTAPPTQFLGPGAITGYARNDGGAEFPRYHIGSDGLFFRSNAGDDKIVVDGDTGTITTDGGIFAGTSNNKFVVGAGTGNTAIAGTLAVTGATTLTGAVAANGGITVDSTAFTVANTTGNTAIAGTLAVTGATTLTGSLAANGNFLQYNYGGLYKNTAQTVNSGADARITFQVAYLNGDLSDVANHRLLIVHAGFYIVSAGVVGNAVHTWQVVTGGAYGTGQVMNGQVIADMRSYTTKQVYLAAGTELELWVRNTGGGNLTVTTGVNGTVLSAAKVG